MDQRRDFIKKVAVFGLAAGVPNFLKAGQQMQTAPPNDKIWACMLHLTFNKWEDHNKILEIFPGADPTLISRVFDENLRVSEALWNDALKKMVDGGMNMVVIDLGDAIKYESHPEIAVKNAWSTTRLRDELAKIRKMGLEPIPKLNFSTAHDIWLKDYSKMVSTQKYYEVCSDLIKEVINLFDKPRFFHLGYDEENLQNQKYYDYVVIRHNDLWWKDFYFFVNEVEKNNVRPWIWSDYAWHYPEMFYKKMPKSVVQSNWYYRDSFDVNETPVKTYLDLEAHGYDQIPTAAYYEVQKGKVNSEINMLKTVQFSEKNIADKRLFGFLKMLCRPTMEEYRNRIIKGIELTGEAKNWYRKNH